MAEDELIADDEQGVDPRQRHQAKAVGRAKDQRLGEQAQRTDEQRRVDAAAEPRGDRMVCRSHYTRRCCVSPKSP